MNKKNEFENFCDQLSDGEINKIDYVRKQLLDKYGNSTDMYLVIKAEAQEDDYMQYMTMRMSLLAMIISFFANITQFITSTGNQIIDFVFNIIYLLLFICAIYRICIVDKYTSVSKWRKYILAVIDDLIEESKNADNK